MRANWMYFAAIVTVLSLAAGCISATPVQPAPEARPLATQPPATQAPPTPAPPTPAPPALVPITAAPPTATSAPPTAAASALPTPLSALMDVVKAYEAAVNRDDESGFPALFPEQFVSDWVGETSMVNQKQLTEATAFFAAMHDGMRLTECRQSRENQVKCSATYWDDCYKAAGVPAITTSLGFTILDNKIKLLSFQVAESSRADLDKVDAFMINAALWMRQQHPALQHKVRDSKGEYIMSSEAGATWSQLCQEYAETLK